MGRDQALWAGQSELETMSKLEEPWNNVVQLLCPFSNFTGEETETQRGELIYLGSQVE